MNDSNVPLEQSYQSMYGLPVTTSISSKLNDLCNENNLTTIPCIIDEIQSIYTINEDSEGSLTWYEKKSKIINLMTKIQLNYTEISKYIHYDDLLPYTRNLLATDNINYTLLLLCWSPGVESKIHDHPCDGCFVKTIIGIYSLYI